MFEMRHNLLNSEADEIPNHEKIKPNEQPQHSPTVRHQGAQGVGQLLRFGKNTRSVEHYLHLG